MESEEIAHVQKFLSTTVFTKKHRKLIEDVLYIDIPAEELAEVLENQSEEFKITLQEAAGITTAKITDYLFISSGLNLELHEKGIDDPLKSDSPSLPDLWKNSFNVQNVSFTLKRPFPRLMKGEIELENFNEEEKLSTCIKILRANAEFVLHGVPKLEKQHAEKQAQFKNLLEEKENIEEQNSLKKREPEVSILKSDEKTLYKLWKLGILQCDLKR